MQPILTVALAAGAGVPLGLSLRRNLAMLGYRKEDEQDRPDPGPRWWVVWASVVALGSLTSSAYLSERPITYIGVLPLALTGPWLAAVDLDVLRIQNRVLMPAMAVTLLALLGIAVAERDWSALGSPVVAALATGGSFAAFHLATHGGIGLGDIKLATVIGLALGPIGVDAVWISVLAGSLTTLICAKCIGRGGPIPYGPGLLSGSLLAVLVTAFAP
ncbi:MAG: prepilin peptidase [Propionibacteriaceae bacterium]|nr:prepilin peptidase [Propionibacteriaceae bacterium]